MTDIWHAKTYAKFLDLRTRPAKDLLFAIPDNLMPQRVCDLGCGPGNSTILLKDRWPAAAVVGLDSSRDMLEQAKRDYANLQFIEGDLSTFAPTEKQDCIFSNAALQWVGDHETLIPKLAGFLNPGGVLAIQMPNNFHCPSHQVTVRLLDASPLWRPLLKNLRYGHLSAPFYQAAFYYDVLAGAKMQHIQLWEIEYTQVVDNHQAVFNWVEGTGLRPILSKMSAEDRAAFEKAYVNAVSKAYAVQADGKVLLPFRRLFMVGVM